MGRVVVAVGPSVVDSVSSTILIDSTCPESYIT